MSIQPDERDRAIEVMINRSLTGKMPPDAPKERWAAYNASFKPTKTTPINLAREIYRGYSFCPVFGDGRRKKENFQAGWYVALDFDTGDDLSTLKAVADDQLINWFASFAYTTPSHTPEKPRCRVVFIFDRAITSIDKIELAQRAMLYRFPQADQSCKDGLRLFYGSPRCEVWKNWSILPLESLGELVQQYQIDNPGLVEHGVRETVTIDGGNLTRILQTMASTIASAPHGSRHNTVTKNAYAVGGYVGEGLISQAEALALLEDAIDRSQSSHKADHKRTAAQCLAAGVDSPLKPQRKIQLEAV